MNKTIENLKRLKSFHNGSYGSDINKAIKALEQEPRWTPVSEDPPKEDKYVLICTEDGKIEKAYHTIKEWCEDGEMEWLVFETLGYSYTLDDDEVVAWMPLPQPYKAGGESE